MKQYLITIFFIDACENVKCGQNADCVATRHSGQCKCKIGYEGNAGNGKGCHLREVPCKSNKECSEAQYCRKSICQGAYLINVHFMINNSVTPNVSVL